MSRNEEYREKSRIPKLDAMIVYPMPEATTPVAALRSGQAAWQSGFGNPKNCYTYDPGEAQGAAEGRRLRTRQADEGQDHDLHLGVEPNSATANERVHARELAVRNAPDAPQSHGDNGINISLSFTDPSSMFRYYAIDSFSPIRGHWSNQQCTDLLKKAQATFDPAEQTKLLAAAHEVVVDEAPWLFIVHDLNPRALSSKVKDFHPAQSWYQDFTQISMG